MVTGSLFIGVIEAKRADEIPETEVISIEEVFGATVLEQAGFVQRIGRLSAPVRTSHGVLPGPFPGRQRYCACSQARLYFRDRRVP